MISFSLSFLLSILVTYFHTLVVTCLHGIYIFLLFSLPSISCFSCIVSYHFSFFYYLSIIITLTENICNFFETGASGSLWWSLYKALSHERIHPYVRALSNVTFSNEGISIVYIIYFACCSHRYFLVLLLFSFLQICFMKTHSYFSSWITILVMRDM